ncbi:hypothetical protein ASPFODRAFT_257306 [Aspergillus luchuensis CBS 106.47]|uniref:Uncharacterized protein n=1 Tax=Aspergillus luchuensis (strain CBS 106.47) TaxID=1137211 RepID=A0A1M3TZW8_ASPLC|nr:hypothetical protein ASPFODRAFT_257306 [Aspergillus luchuensis CBS 106.47]
MNKERVRSMIVAQLLIPIPPSLAYESLRYMLTGTSLDNLRRIDIYLRHLALCSISGRCVDTLPLSLCLWD